MSATFATITTWMRLNFFAQNVTPEPEPSATPPSAATVAPPPGKTFPADEIVWGIVIRNGFDELDDPWYHRGTTQHAYLEGNDNVAICGFRPPQSGPRTRRRSRLGLPTPGEHPMCGMCARMVVAPRPRVPVPVQTRPPVAVPVGRPVAVPTAGHMASVPPNPRVAVANAAAGTATGAIPQTPSGHEPAAPVAPWVRLRTQADAPVTGGNMTVELGGRHEAGLLQRGVRTEPSED